MLLVGNCDGGNERFHGTVSQVPGIGVSFNLFFFWGGRVGVEFHKCWYYLAYLLFLFCSGICNSGVKT